MAPASREANAILCLFVLAVLFNVAAASVGWFHALSDVHGWTQAESAIRVLFVLQGGPWLAYETPVFGPPWPFPHELPVYHLIVAALAWATGLPIEPAGRAVSLAFFYAALGALYLLLAELGIGRRHRLLVLTACLLSPLYVFWSRTLTVESTALFLSLAFLALAVRFLARNRWPDGLGALVTGAAAFAVKPPTLAAFAALAGLCWLVHQRRRGYRVDGRLVLGALVPLAAVAIGWSWHGYTDTLKRLNPLGWAAYSSDAMVRDWVVGPPGQRSWPLTFEVLRERTLPDTVGHAAVVVAAALGVALAGRRRTLFTLALLVPILHYLAFTPLHLSHPYDQYATGLFVPLAAGLAAVALLERGGARRHAAWALMALVAIAGIAGWWERMLPLQRQNAYRRPAWFVRLARTLAESTAPTDVLLGFGLSASPEVPYYARRRALMWPDWADPSPDGEDVELALAALAGHRVGALFACRTTVPGETLERFRAHMGLAATPALELAAGPLGRCFVFLRAGSSVPAGATEAGPG